MVLEQLAFHCEGWEMNFDLNLTLYKKLTQDGSRG